MRFVSKIAKTVDQIDGKLFVLLTVKYVLTNDRKIFTWQKDITQLLSSIGNDKKIMV